MEKTALPTWPYPRWIAHRGAGQLAPENTLAAFALGAAHGYRMFECDAQVSTDGQVFLLHDDSLDRTTNGSGLASAMPWSDLAALDAGAWHSPAYAHERLPRLQDVARFCMAHDGLVNIEIKPSPGTAQRTGHAVAMQAAALWANQAVPALLSSFDVQALSAARLAAPALPRALLLENLPLDWLQQAQALDCVAVVMHHPLCTPESVSQAHAAGLRCLSYTVNDAAEAERLIALGIDGLITDRVDLFAAQT